MIFLLASVVSASSMGDQWVKDAMARHGIKDGTFADVNHFDFLVAQKPQQPEYQRQQQPSQESKQQAYYRQPIGAISQKLGERENYPQPIREQQQYPQKFGEEEDYRQPMRENQRYPQKLEVPEAYTQAIRDQALYFRQPQTKYSSQASNILLKNQIPAIDPITERQYLLDLKETVNLILTDLKGKGLVNAEEADYVYEMVDERIENKLRVM